MGSAANHNRAARLQVVGHPGGREAEVTGWLLVWTRRSWRVEAVY